MRYTIKRYQALTEAAAEIDYPTARIGEMANQRKGGIGMTTRIGKKEEMLSLISYLQKQLNKSFDTIDDLNKYIFALRCQIKAMGGEPPLNRRGGDRMELLSGDSV